MNYEKQNGDQSGCGSDGQTQQRSEEEHDNAGEVSSAEKSVGNTAKSLRAGRNVEKLIGSRYGKLVVIGKAPRQGKYMTVECRCDCGSIAIAKTHKLYSGRTTSCGCLRGAHRMSKTESYRSWTHMMDRCLNPKCDAWYNYGGRGITVCEEWKTFTIFYSDMGKRPNGTSIDRIDNDKGYSKDNCRWATKAQQAVNTRKNKTVVLNGVSMPTSSALKAIGMSRCVFSKRLAIFGWTVEKALNTPYEVNAEKKYSHSARIERRSFERSWAKRRKAM